MLLLLYVKEVEPELPVLLILLLKPKNGGYLYFKQGNGQAAMQKILIEYKNENKDFYFLSNINMRES